MGAKAAAEAQKRLARTVRPAQLASFATGQCPVMRYHRQLMEAILHDKAHIAKAVNATVISLDEAPNGYRDFDKGISKKFVLDPHGLIHA